MKGNRRRYRLAHVELNSRLEMQERSLQTYAKEIYENIGQVLSLVKMQLQSLPLCEMKDTKEILSSGQLLGKAIADLRNLTKQLTPEEVIRNGFADSIGLELRRLTHAGLCNAKFTLEGTPGRLEDVRELVVFCVLQQIVYPLLNAYEPGNVSVAISYKKKRIEIKLMGEFAKQPLFLDIKVMARYKKRLKAINSTIEYKNEDWEFLQIIINI